MTASRTRSPNDQAPNMAADRVLQVLSAFLTTDEELGVVEISRLLGLDKSVVHRILATLTQHRYLDQNPRTSKYRVGLVAWELGQRYRARSWVADAAVPLLADLVREHGSSGYVAALDGAEIVYLATVDGAGPFQVHVDVGSRLPAYTTALGRAILAGLPAGELAAILDATPPSSVPLPEPGTGRALTRAGLEAELAATRERGYAVNQGQSRPGVGAVGAAVRNSAGLVFGAISVAFPMMPPFDELWETLPGEVRRVAAEISGRLG